MIPRKHGPGRVFAVLDPAPHFQHYARILRRLEFQARHIDHLTTRTLDRISAPPGTVARGTPTRQPQTTAPARPQHGGNPVTGRSSSHVRRHRKPAATSAVRTSPTRRAPFPAPRPISPNAATPTHPRHAPTGPIHAAAHSPHAPTIPGTRPDRPPSPAHAHARRRRPPPHAARITGLPPPAGRPGHRPSVPPDTTPGTQARCPNARRCALYRRRRSPRPRPPRALTIASRNSRGLSASTSRTSPGIRTIAHHAPVACPYQATTPENSRSTCAATGRRPVSSEADTHAPHHPHPPDEPDEPDEASEAEPSRDLASRRTAPPGLARSVPPPSPRRPPGTTAPTPAETCGSAPTRPTTTRAPRPGGDTAPLAASPAPASAPAGHCHRVHRPGCRRAPRRAPMPCPPGPAAPIRRSAPTPPDATRHQPENSPTHPHAPLPKEKKSGTGRTAAAGMTYHPNTVDPDGDPNRASAATTPHRPRSLDELRRPHLTRRRTPATRHPLNLRPRTNRNPDQHRPPSVSELPPTPAAVPAPAVRLLVSHKANHPASERPIEGPR